MAGGKKKNETTAPEAGAAPTVDVTELVARLDRQQQLIDQLTQALVASRTQNAAIAQGGRGDEVFAVTNMGLAGIGFNVFDDRGVVREFYLPQKGSIVYLTRAQILELQQKAPQYFDKGYISAPEIVPPTANTIPDYDAFLRSLPVNDIKSRVGALDSIEQLYNIYAHIEAQRFTDTDASGQKLKDNEGRPRLEIVELDPKLLLVQAAIKQRLMVLGVVPPSEDGGE